MVRWATRAAKRPVLFEKGPKRYKGSFQTIKGGGGGEESQCNKEQWTSGADVGV